MSYVCQNKEFHLCHRSAQRGSEIKALRSMGVHERENITFLALYPDFPPSFRTAAMSQNHRITELLRLEKTFKITKSSCQPECHHLPMSLIHTPLEYLQGQRLHHLPGQSFPVPSDSFEEVFPNIQTEGRIW